MNPNDRQVIESVFAGSGEIAMRLRELDWSATPLGPVEQWPQALRTIVRVVLGSGYPMAICWGPDYVLLYNEAYRPIAGARHPWALGRGAREVYPEAWDFIGPMYESVMARGQAANFLSDVLVPLSRNNYLEEVYFAFSASPLPDDSGRVGGVLNSALETTERVIEDRRRHLLRDLASRVAGARTEEEVWRVSAEILGENCISLPFAFLYEYRPSEHQAYLAGASLETGDALHPAVIDCRSENLWRLDPALARDAVLVELGDLASGVSVPNWPERPKEASVAPIRLGEHGDAAGFLVAGIHPGQAFGDAYRQFVQRVVEQIAIGLASARAYEQERQRAEALAELDRAKTTFFSNVSHEFRTPLTLMLGPLEEVLAHERLEPEGHKQLVTVRRNGIRLLKLVNTLLDFSRIESGRVQASYQPADLAGFTTEIASAFDSAMKIVGLRFSVECQPIADPVYVDRDMWEKIVLNLLSNAYKFTFTGEVALTLQPVDGAVELKVRDTGVGIPEEHLEHVFERFHRIESTQARTYEGTGIGLALVEELVKLHGGSVRVESAVGAGSTFTVTIPSGTEHLSAERIQAAQTLPSTTIRAEAYVEELQQWLGNEPGVAADLARPPKLTSPAPSSEPSPDAKRKPIVVADDNADMRQYLTRLLSERYEVHAVADGRQALEATQQLRPAVVLADVMMPHLDGFGLLRAIREDSALAGTPVVLVSARAGEESRVEGLEADADDYLIKPFAAPELLARVAAHVKMSNLRRETAEREGRMRGEAELDREKLRASEERLAETSRLYREQQKTDAELHLQVELLQHLPVSAWTLKPDGTPDFVNQVWLEFSGQSLDFVRSHPEAWMAAVHPEDRETASKALWDGVRSGQGFAFATRSLRAQDGTYRWHLQQAVALHDADGKVLKFVGATTDIDDQKRAEEALRASEANLRRVIDTIPSLSWCNLPDGPNEFLSKGWHDYTGLSPEEAHGWGWSASFHPDDLPPLMNRWQELLVSGEPGEIEARIRRHDGEYRWFLIRVAPFRDESGAIFRWYGTSTDIHDRKLAEEALRASENNLRQTVNSLPGLICTMNPAGEIEELNRPLLEYFGKTPEELRGWRMTDAVHPDDLPEVIKAYTYSITNGTPYEIEHRCRRADGVYRWFQVRASAVRNTDGQITGWYVLLTDIDDRKRGEDELKRSEARHRVVVETASDAVVSIDESGEIILANPATKRIFGYNPEELIGKPLTVLMPGVMRKLHETGLKRYLETGTRHLNWQGTEVTAMRANGEEFPAEVSFGEMISNHRKVFTGFIRDISDKKRAHEELLNSQAELARMTRVVTIGQLTASIAHEVNQPLSGIITNASTCLRMLKSDPPNIDGARETAQRALRDGNRASDVITRLRTLLSKKQTDFEPLDLNEAAREVITLLSGELQRNEVILKHEFTDRLPAVKGDRVQLQQVILNLLHNASDAMLTVNDRPRQVLIRTEPDATHVTVSVQDSGVGFSPEMSERLFEPFLTTKQGGMGIGLSVSRSIVEAHQGRLWAARNAGPGATFAFSIPQDAENLPGQAD
jgi:PAS domain S-box-containing protein